MVCLVVAALNPAVAQTSPVETKSPSTSPFDMAALPPEAPSATAATASSPLPTPKPNGASGSDRWQVTWYPLYLWTPGFDGTVGAGGLTAEVDAKFTDIVDELNFAYMTAFDARKGMYGVTTDFVYTSLTDQKTLGPGLLFSGTEADARLLIFNPQFYLRLNESDRGTADVTMGLRYWHLKTDIRFLPGILPATAVSGSDDWVEPVVGTRFRLNLDDEKKWYVPIRGDVGGFGAGSQLSWQAMAGIGRDFKERYTMVLGYRHLSVDRRNGNQIFNVGLGGLLMGVGVKFGHEEPIPPSASCTLEPAEVMAGEPVRVTASGANFPKGRALVYTWNSTGGKVAGAENVGTVDTSGLAPGSYTVSARVSDNKKKSADCSASFTVKEPPRNPPQVSCSANPATVQSGEASTISCSCTSPDGRPVNLAWSSSGGRLSDSGNTAQLDTAGSQAGSIAVSTTCTDDRGLSDSARSMVSVTVPPPPPQAEKINEIAFKKNSARVDNAAKASLDDVALRLQRDADAKAVIVGQADSAERRAAQLAMPRADNAKAYLVTEKGIDASRIETRAGAEGGQRAEIVIVPPGASY